MKLAITGAYGFMGWHSRCALKARGDDFVPIGRDVFSETESLDRALCGVDAVLHLAGANRADPSALREGNYLLARTLTESLDRLRIRPPIVYANSIHSGEDSPFGEGKQLAADHLTRWGIESGARVWDVRLPNLFGEHGRPEYNSVVATFSHKLATGQTPDVHVDRELALLHVQDAIDLLLQLLALPEGAVVRPEGFPITVSDLLTQLVSFHDSYSRGVFPDLESPLHLPLFNTYRSYLFPEHFPIHPDVHSDERGSLFECLRAVRGQSQVFCSSTLPGRIRGQHFHRRKVERFLVIGGSAEISVRRLFDDSIVRFEVSGAVPAIVDMPTMWTHSIRNTGAAELTTLFWTHELFNELEPDTYPEAV